MSNISQFNVGTQVVAYGDAGTVAGNAVYSTHPGIGIGWLIPVIFDGGGREWVALRDVKLNTTSAPVFELGMSVDYHGEPAKVLSIYGRSLLVQEENYPEEIFWIADTAVAI